MADVGIVLYEDVEVLDCCGPFEVFTTAARLALRRGWAPPLDMLIVPGGVTGECERDDG